MNRDRRSSRVVGAVALVVLLGLAGGVLLMRIMPHGIGVSSDSILYLLGADSLRDGEGWSRPSGGGTTEPITHFPPLYSLILAGAAGQDGTPLRAASPTASFLFAGVIIATGLALVLVEGSPAAGVATALILAVSPILLSVFAWAMSEPLYLLLGVLSLLSLVKGLRGGHLGWLLLAGVLTGLAYLTRYVGVALIATGILLVLLRAGWRRRERLWAVASFAAPSLICIATWSARNSALTGTATNRSLAWHALSSTKWKSPFGLIWTWLLPFEFDFTALLATVAVVAILLILGTVLVVRRRSDVSRAIDGWRDRPTLAVAAAMYLMVYSGVVALSLMFFDAATPVDERIAAPVYLSLVIVLAAAWALAVQRGTKGWVRPVLLVFAAALVLSYADRTGRLAADLQRDGQGLASQGWQHSPVIAAARELHPQTLFFTNNPEAFTFFTGVGAYGLPVERDGVTGLGNPDLARDLATVRDQLRPSGGAVVLFGGPGAEAEWRYLAPLLSELDLLAAVSDGRVYYAPEPD